MSQKENRITRRIKQISVTDLFGIFHHVIPLNMDERITIIHGPNGFGKTIILRILNDLFSQETINFLLPNDFFSYKGSALRTIPFSEFRVDFEDGTSFWVTKTSNGHKFKDLKQPQQKITIYATQKGIQTSYELEASSQLSTIRSMSGSQQRFLREFERIDIDRWHNNFTDEDLSFEEVTKLFGKHLPLTMSIHEKEPGWLKEM